MTIKLFWYLSTKLLIFNFVRWKLFPKKHKYQLSIWKNFNEKVTFYWLNFRLRPSELSVSGDSFWELQICFPSNFLETFRLILLEQARLVQSVKDTDLVASYLLWKCSSNFDNISLGNHNSLHVWIFNKQIPSPKISYFGIVILPCESNISVNIMLLLVFMNNKFTLRN